MPLMVASRPNLQYIDHKHYTEIPTHVLSLDSSYSMPLLDVDDNDGSPNLPYVNDDSKYNIIIWDRHTLKNTFIVIFFLLS